MMIKMDMNKNIYFDYLKRLIICTALAFLHIASSAQSQDLLGFDRASFGSVVLSRTQAVGTDIQLELSVGSYENEPIKNYSAGSIFAQMGRSVGRLDVLTDKGVFPCTAFIVSKKYILTNYHCSLGILDNERIGATQIQATQFVAGYTQTGIDEGTKKYMVVSQPVETNKMLDYAVLEVIGDPSQEYGQLKLASAIPTDGDPFWIIGHPMGEGQRISREKCKANAPAVSAGKLLHTCDTLPGNSGSPVIDAGLQQVVALHHAGSQKDSVNFAILMSEILEKSTVLVAYRASDEAPKDEPQTATIDNCDALYSAAAGAKACYAYDVYIKNCTAHKLAPMAHGFINEFCQPNEPIKLDRGAEKTCNDDPRLCDEDQLCDRSITFVSGKAEWRAHKIRYVIEAKSRGLECDLIMTAMPSKSQCPGVYNRNTWTKCDGTQKLSGGAKYIGEFEGGLRHGNGSFTFENSSKWVGHKYVGSFRDGKYDGQGTYTYPNGSKYVGGHIKGEKYGAGIFIWKSGQVRFEKKFEDLPKGWKSNSSIHQVFPNLKSVYSALRVGERKKIQLNLKELGFYSSKIDGQWGRQTLTALVEFSSITLGSVDLSSNIISMKLLDKLR